MQEVLADQFETGEEIGDFFRSGFGSVGTMNRVFTDGLREFLADRAFGGFCRVGRAHHFAILRDGVLAFQNLRHDRGGGHEIAKFVIEGALCMHLVELASLGLGEVNPLLGDDAEAGSLEFCVNRASEVACGRIRLDDRESALNRHCGSSFWCGLMSPVNFGASPTMGARDVKAHFEMFAFYNAWANRRLYSAVAGMSDEMRKAPAGFFGSLHNTLNHLVVADRIWMHRFTGEGETYNRLDEVPYPDFTELRAARAELDHRIAAFVATTTYENLRGEFTYTPISIPEPITQPLGPALAHFFNHQTHHRGQCHHMLTAAGVAAPPLDLIYFQREAG